MSLPFTQLIFIVWAAFLVATHISLTLIVYKDAKALRCPALGITPFLWAGISFSLPVIGMFVYWLMNYSILCRSLGWRNNFDSFNEKDH